MGHDALSAAKNCYSKIIARGGVFRHSVMGFRSMLRFMRKAVYSIPYAFTEAQHSWMDASVRNTVSEAYCVSTYSLHCTRQFHADLSPKNNGFFM